MRAVLSRVLVIALIHAGFSKHTSSSTPVGNRHGPLEALDTICPDPQGTIETIKRDSPSTIVPKAAVTHSVDGGDFRFEPNTIIAEVGDIILFKIWPGGHGVSRAAFEYPCLPYNDIEVAAPPGFWSTVLPATEGSPATYQVNVNDTEPAFFYCTAPCSCKGRGMIGVINPNSTMTLAAQKNKVDTDTPDTAPGEAMPQEGAAPDDCLGPSSTSTNVHNNYYQGSSLSPVAIVGIAIGGTALPLLAALLYLCWRKGGFEKGFRCSNARPTSNHLVVEANYSNAATTTPSNNLSSSIYGGPASLISRNTSPGHWSPHSHMANLHHQSFHAVSGGHPPLPTSQSPVAPEPAHGGPLEQVKLHTLPAQPPAELAGDVVADTSRASPGPTEASLTSPTGFEFKAAGRP
ncbi:hypothetical protein F5Y15DRAFT_419748 [Xylariaceae sp. FL0016]|nr:hypothetical protein F5Y15DRAFT_419748 [Xylariaceae sp. FL0016]